MKLVEKLVEGQEHIFINSKRTSNIPVFSLLGCLSFNL